MAQVLFLAHRYPYPPNKGDKIRAFHIAEHLRKNHEVSLGFIVTPADGEPDLSWAAGNLRSYHAGRVSTTDRFLRTGVAFMTGQSLSVAAFRHFGLMRWVRHFIDERRPEFIYLFSSAMAQYLPTTLPDRTRVVLDFVDVDSEKWRQYAQTQSWARRWFYGMEAERLLKFDRKQAARAHVSAFVSQDEKRVFDRLSPETISRHIAIANGVDIQFFDPTAASWDNTGQKSIVFVGVMDYWPNIDAVVWFAREILPLVRARHVDATFRIVGARPTAAVMSLGELEGVAVTGAVPDIRPYLATASVVVAPLRIARGIQNKVLEGMAMARPLVATPGALEGICAEPGRDVLAGGSADEFANAVICVLDGRAPSSLGLSARGFVARKHDWRVNLKALDDALASLT